MADKKEQCIFVIIDKRNGRKNLVGITKRSIMHSMESFELWPEDAEMSVAALINTTVLEERAPEKIFLELKAQRERLDAGHRAQIDRYIAGVRPAVAGALVEPLPQNVGGQWDGDQVSLATASLLVGESVKETVDRLEETRAHEEYHKCYDHTASMIAGASADDSSIVQIGGKKFDDTALIEGVTVARTGEQFVSAQYRRYKADVLSALANAGIGLSTLEQAIEAKDLRPVDDAYALSR